MLACICNNARSHISHEELLLSFVKMKIPCESVISFCVVLDGTVSWPAGEIWEDCRVPVGRDSQVHEGLDIIRSRPGASADRLPDREG